MHKQSARIIALEQLAERQEKRLVLLTKRIERMSTAVPDSHERMGNAQAIGDLQQRTVKLERQMMLLKSATDHDVVAIKDIRVAAMEQHDRIGKLEAASVSALHTATSPRSALSRVSMLRTKLEADETP